MPTNHTPRSSAARTAAPYIGLSLLAISSCATTASSTDPQPAAEAPTSAQAQPTKAADPAPGTEAWVEAVMSKEVELPTQAMKYEAQEHSGEVLSLTPVKTEVQEGYVYLVANIGSEAPVECFLYRRQLDIATAINVMAKNVIENMGKAAGGVEKQQLAETDVGSVGRRPYLLAAWVYRLGGTGQGAQLGFLKLVGVLTETQVSVCLHNQLGYSKTFRAWAEHFIRNYRNASAAPKLQYAQITREELNGNPIGFSQTLVSNDPDGGFRIDSTAVMLTARGPEVIPQDRRSVVFADADGMLINSAHATSQGTNLKVDPADAGYRVHGMFAGKNVEFNIETGKKLSTEVDIERGIRRVLTEPGQQDLSYQTFISSFPDRVSDFNVSESAARPDGMTPIKATVGQMTATMMFKGADRLEYIDTVVGPVKIRSTVLHSEGKY